MELGRTELGGQSERGQLGVGLDLRLPILVLEPGLGVRVGIGQGATADSHVQLVLWSR